MNLFIYLSPTFPTMKKPKTTTKKLNNFNKTEKPKPKQN